MFAIEVNDEGEVVLRGRLDATQTETANAVFDMLTQTTRVNFKDLDYISSAGLGVLLKTQKRLGGEGHRLILTKINKIVGEVFRITRFDLVFDIENGS